MVKIEIIDVKEREKLKISKENQRIHAKELADLLNQELPKGYLFEIDYDIYPEVNIYKKWLFFDKFHTSYAKIDLFALNNNINFIVYAKELREPLTRVAEKYEKIMNKEVVLKLVNK